MAENNNSTPTTGRRAAAVITGSALALSTVAFGAPAAFAGGDHAPQEKAQPAEVDRDTQADEQQLEVTPDTNKAQAGETFTVSGSGFTPDEHVQLAMGNELIVDAQADENGDFSADVTIPEDFEIGFYDLVVSETATGNVSSTDFKVFDDEGQDDDDEKDDQEEADPDVELASDAVAPGEALQVSGEDFTPEGAVSVRLHPSQNIASDENGDISTEIVIPEDLEEGSYELIVTDQETGEQETEEITVAADGQDDHADAQGDDGDDHDDVDDTDRDA